ncbi:sigma-70 family RNA polymerase sigma factor [Stakelama sediminis]|uniref:RNA polymerase sigma-70 factor (ECF subfamily) n=1 Tax=Stakelama sediminis TaxID=463200 RepID=A0A840YYD4_9SPHN|nr:RNA polymerase sigma factor [Stakelama sediminis]MBB5718540.1 RNA polymerase sigma-70 factor (ECF subfamily) [Stakelama sediminis]
MDRDAQDGLGRILLDNRMRLIRFLTARGAGDEAEDLVQELWQRIHALPGGPVQEPLSYLYRAAENLMRDRYRARTSRVRREQDWQDGPGAADAAPGGEQLLIARERLRQAEATLSALGPRVETVFRRFRIDGVTQAHIASELGISVSTVEKDLQKAYRALARLQEKFDAE